jgi:hypothetical protein
MKFEKGTWTEWRSAAKKPDADTTVLVFAPKADDPVQSGYWDGEVWRDVLGMPYAAHVEMWAELPYPVEAKLKIENCKSPICNSPKAEEAAA